jgi:hypothetical protein
VIGTFVGNTELSATPTLSNSVSITEFGEIVDDKDFILEYIYEEGEQTSEYIIYSFEIGPDGYYVLTPINKTTPLLRFVDTSSRVDLISYKGTFFNSPSSYPIEYTIQVYESDDFLDSDNPLWIPNEVSGLTEYLFIQRSKRFVKFEIEFFSDLPDQYFNSDIYRIIQPTGQNEDGLYIYDFSEDQDGSIVFVTELQELTPIEFLLLVEIQIAEASPPNITNSTKDILKKFPSWTKIYEDSLDDATPSLAIPESFAGKFVNALIGDNLDKIESLIDYFNLSKSISGASTDQITWIYSTNNSPELVTSVVGDNVSLSPITQYSDFISHNVDDYVYFYSIGDRTVFTLRAFKELKINNIVYEQNETLVFNMFDEFGARVGLPRLKMEGNENYKKRILDVYINKPGPDLESFKKTVRRELDLWRALGSTPDSYFGGATPIVYEMSDLEKQEKYFDKNGNPTEKFIEFVNILNKEYPTNWGFVQWSDLIWDYAGKFSEGISRVPFVYDAEFAESTPKYYQPGVGDLSDLKLSIMSNSKFDSDLVVFDENFQENIYEKQATIKISGIEKNETIDSYVPINVDLEYYTEYQLPVVLGDAATINYVVEVDVNGVTYYTNITDYYKNTYTNNLFNNYDESGIRKIISPIDNRTSSDLVFRRKSNNAVYIDTSATPNLATIDSVDISSGRIIYGKFEYSSTTPRYVVSGHSSTNLSWISVPNQSKKYSTSYTNGNYATPTYPYFTVTGPNSYSFEVAYGSNMYQIGFETYNTPTRYKTITLKSEINGSNISTPNYQESFSNFIDHIYTVQAAATPKYLHIENIKPDFAYIDSNYATPSISHVTGYGGYANHPQYISDLLIPNILVRKDNNTGELFATPKYDISSGSATPNQLFFYWDPNYSVIQNQYTLNGTAQKNYPFDLGDWSYFEAELATPITFKLSERGAILSSDDLNTSKILSDVILSRNVHRYEFDMNQSATANYIINNIEAVKLDEDDNSFEIYTEKRSVKPYYSINQEGIGNINNVTYLPSRYYEEKSQGEYNDLYIENVTVRSRLTNLANREIKSEINSGWYYRDNDEFYVYARPITELYHLDINLSTSNESATPTIILSGISRQGAPVIVEPASSPNLELTQISFPDQFDNTKISFINVEYITARDEYSVYLGYNNVYDVNIYDPISDQYVIEDAESTDNEINIVSIPENGPPFIIGREYKVSYKVRNTYYVDNENLNELNNLYTKIVFNNIPTNGATAFYVTYESSLFETSTPTGLNHSPSKTLPTGGYIYLDDEIYDYRSFTVNVNPGSILDNPQKDYIVVSIESFDANGNPKPYQKYELESSLLSFDETIIETDIDGFGYTKARYSGATPSTYNYGTLFVSGIVDDYSSASDQATINYQILKSESNQDSLSAEPSSRFMEANGESTIYINGQLNSKTKDISNVYVYYRKARTVSEIFEISEYNYVMTDSNGSFRVGPITAQEIENSGYWYMALETEYSSTLSGSPVTISGDIVSWFEDSNDVILNASERRLPIQDSYDADDFAEFKSTPVFKVNYITGNPETPTATPNIELPKWFRIPRYTQYQMGILGNQYYFVDNNKNFYPS